MAQTSNDVVNQALVYNGYDGNPVTGEAPSFDTSTAGKAAARFYQQVVGAVLRQSDFGFARMETALAQSGNSPPITFAFEYIYPSNCIQLLQLLPGTIADQNDPRPIEWTPGNALIASAQRRVIWTNLAAAQAFFTGYAVEATWDAGFREAVVRLLSAVMALAISGKPEASQVLIETYGQFQSIAESRRD